MATRTWSAAVDGVASLGANWSGATAPTTGDSVIFDGTSIKNCTWDITANMGDVTVNSAYTGTVTQTSAFNVTDATGTRIFTFNGGVWNSNGQTVSVRQFDASGTATKTLSCGASAWTCGTLLNLSGSSLTFTPSTSVFTMNNAGTLTPHASTAFAGLTLDGTNGGTLTLGNNVTITGTFTMQNSVTIAGNFIIHAQGNISRDNTTASISGSPTLTIDGGANQTWSDNATGTMRLPVTINKSGNTLTLSGTINLYNGPFTYTAGTVSAGTSTVVHNGTYNVASNGMSFYNMSVDNSATVTLTSNLSVTNILNIISGAGLTASSYTITMGGNFTKGGTFTANTSTVTFNGTSTVSGTITFNNLTINSGKVVHLTSTQTFTVSGAFTTLGTSTLDATTGGSRANLSVNGSQSVTGVTATDIDSSGGSVKPIHNSAGSNTNTVQWDIPSTAVNIIKAMLMGIG